MYLEEKSYVFLLSNSHIIPVYLHMCWRLRICFNLDTGFKSWTRIGPRSGRRWRKNKYRPERECSTAFSIKSTIVLLLNLVRLPKLKLPEITKRCSFQIHLNHNRDYLFIKYFPKSKINLPWSCSIRTWLTFPFNLKVNEKI